MNLPACWQHLATSRRDKFRSLGCIFPTLFIVLMGPVALILLQLRER